MDGNGRWAKSKGKSRYAGHKEGVNSVRDIVEASAELGVNFLTLYTFSTENWRRPKSEVDLLMKLLISTLRKETDRLHRNNVKLISTGNLNSLPEKVRDQLNEAMRITKDNDKMTLNLALSYSGRWDILNAVKNVCNDYLNGNLHIDNLTEETFSSYLVTKNIPDPDLMIRTGGDFRISNFLLWQVAYSEIYIESDYWPDFKRNKLYEAISEYQKRERRYGMVSEQLINHKVTRKV
jgi:undecaprenyl diphosphate synthase